VGPLLVVVLVSRQRQLEARRPCCTLLLILVLHINCVSRRIEQYARIHQFLAIRPHMKAAKKEQGEASDTIYSHACFCEADLIIEYTPQTVCLKLDSDYGGERYNEMPTSSCIYLLDWRAYLTTQSLSSTRYLQSP